MIYTTLNAIRAFGSSKNARTKLLSYLGKTQPDDEPLPLVTVLDSNGLDDAIWCLRHVCPDVAAEFVQWCAGRTGAVLEARDARYARIIATRAAELARDLAAEADSLSARADYCAGAEHQAQTDKLRELLS